MASFTGILLPLLLLATTSPLTSAFEYNTFDGPGFPSCHNVTTILNATSIADIQAAVQSASASGSRIRAAGKGHMWYDTQCSDAATTIVRTEGVARISDFSLPAGADSGTVWVEAGVTFFQLAEYLHERGASVGYTLTNWNITFGGSVAMGAHRSSIREESMVAAGVVEMEIVDGKGEVRRLSKEGGGDEWFAASTSLGLLGVIVRLRLRVYPDTKVYAKQVT